MRHFQIALVCLFLSWLPGQALHAQATPDPANLTAIWYNTSEAGYGVNVVHQGSILFVAWYTFGSDGRILWLLSAAQRQADGRYVGPIHTFNGTPFNQINAAQAFTSSNQVGEARLQLAADGKLDFGYTVNGTTQAKRLEKIKLGDDPLVCEFTTASRAAATNYTDIWWNAQESGWGLSMIHQDDLMFVAWYTYDSSNRPMWITGLLSRQSGNVFSGPLNRAESGTPLTQINGPATSFPLPTIGNATLTFQDGERAQFRYTVDNITQTKAIERYVYVGAGTPVTLCRSEVDNGPGPGTGPLAVCDPGVHVGDMREFDWDSATQRTTERVPRMGTFNGQQAYVMEQFDKNGVMTARWYQQVTDQDILHIGSEAFSNGRLTITTTYNPPARFPRRLAVGETRSYSYVGNNTGDMTYTVQYSETYKRLDDTTTTTPVGTFPTCSIERRLTTTTFGFAVPFEMDFTTSPVVGTMRGFSRTTAAGANANANQTLHRTTVNGTSYGP